MYRVMIVDDEPLILAGIASLLNWEEYDCVIAGKAGNGQLALAMMEDQMPDIVITDIKMPGMDGLGLMQQARQRGWREVSFILLTNLEEFDLARRALSLGAVEYLVKMELTPERLAQALQAAVKQQQQQRRGGQEAEGRTRSDGALAEEAVKRLLAGEEPGEGAPWEQTRAYLKRPVLLMISFHYGYEGFSQRFTREDQRKIISFAENVIGQMAKGYFDHTVLARRELDSLLLICGTENRPDWREQAEKLGEKIGTVVRDYFEISVSIAVSGEKDGLGEFPAMLYEAMSATDYYFGRGGSLVVFYSQDCEASRRHASVFHIGVLKKDLAQAVEASDSARMREILRQVAQLLEENTPSRQQAVNACANLYFFLVSFFENEGDDFPYEVNVMEKLGHMGTLEQIIGWIDWFAQAVCQILEKRKENRPDRIAELVRDYVMEHYRERVTLGQTAEALGISQGYLSTAFKKQSGTSFTAFVSETKIEKAKELVASHKYMMYEISDMLGFDTPFYFSRVFKKVTGLSPKEYELRSRAGKT